MHDLMAWTPTTMSRKMEKLDGIDRYFRNLISQLLSKDATKRPDTARVLQHPFITGRESLFRMIGEMSLYDVFLSYRVAADSNVAEALFYALTGCGLKVWWDKECLLTGQDSASLVYNISGQGAPRN
jgi:hypothetical protein